MPALASVLVPQPGVVVTTVVDEKGGLLSESRTSFNGDEDDVQYRAFGFGKGAKQATTTTSVRPELL